MASGLLLLLDDIATVLDDVAVMSKMAAKNCWGTHRDDRAECPASEWCAF